MIHLFFTGGSGNRGCEAIVRGTKEILTNQELVVYSSNLQEEVESGLNEVIKCRSLNCGRAGRISHILCWFSYHFGNQKLQVRELYPQFFKSIKKEDSYFVIGGDVYCYEKPSIYYRVNEILRNNKKILWGCSIEPDSIDDEMKKDLQGYDLIYARESITYDGLVSHGITKNVKLYPDPAFKMKMKEVSLPEGFRVENTIGINISPLITNLEQGKGITIKNYEKVIDYILKDTNCTIALIPHVIWKSSDDREALKVLYDKYKNSRRVIMVEAFSAEKIKYIISKCRFLIAARTHASIAGYSTGVPTLVVGYSVKARGIAKDIFGEYEHYTIPVQSLKKENDLLNAFLWMWNKENEIRRYLKIQIPEYIKKLDEIIL